MPKSEKSKRRTLRTVSTIIDRLLGGTRHHFSCYLPGKMGFFPSLVMNRFYSGIKDSSNQVRYLKSLPAEAIVVYTSKYKSYFEYLFYYTRRKKNQVYYPVIGFDYKVFLLQPVTRIFRILLSHTLHALGTRKRLDPYQTGYLGNELLSGKSAFLSLVDEKGFYKRFVKRKKDPIVFLIELQQSTQRPVILVPQLMFFSNKPPRSAPSMIDIFFGSLARPGLLRRWAILFRNPDKAFVEISEPVYLNEYIDRPENTGRPTAHLALALRRDLLLQFNRHRQSITGPVLKTRTELKESILTGDRMKAFMEEYATTQNMPIHQVRRKSDAYLEEIAAKYSLFVIRILAVILRWIVDTIFEGINVNEEGVARVKNMSKRAPVILLPCHKSHIDYLMISYIMFHSNMPCPHIVAGKNLSFWPMGPLFRNSGAFFMRRTFKGARLYATVFSEYVSKLLSEGFNIEVFIEGGRSRTGKLLRPKLGFLQILMDAYLNGACKDLIFIPIYIGYDRVPEENAYLHELEGGKKEPESLKQMIHARKVLKKRFGKIYINFDQPMSLRAIMQREKIKPDRITRQDINRIITEVGQRALSAIDRITVVTPHALVASAILNSSRKRIGHDHILEQIDMYLHHLMAQKTQLADTLVLDPVGAVEQVIDSYLSRKFIEKIATGDNEDNKTVYQVNENKRPILQYYKNNAISFFTPAAFMALAILEKDAFQFTAPDLLPGFCRLQEFFSNEFSCDRDQSPEKQMRKTIKTLINEAIIIPHATLPDTYNLTSAGFRKLKRYAAFVQPYCESYWVVLQYFKSLTQAPKDAKERIRRIQSLGNKMYRQEEIEQKESLSKINYINAVDYFRSIGAQDGDGQNILSDCEAFLQLYLNLLKE